MLDITWSKEEPATAPATVWAVPVRSAHDADAFEQRYGGGVRAALEAAPFRGKAGETFSFSRERNGQFETVVLIGVGDGLDSANLVRLFGHTATTQAQAVGGRQLIVDLSWNDSGKVSGSLSATQLGNALSQGLELGTYVYDRFLSEEKRKPKTLEKVSVWSDSTAATEGTARGQIVARSIARARDLANGPAGFVTPSYLAQVAAEIQEQFKDKDVALKVLDRSECEALNMGCYLGVAQGSDEPPKFIHLSYKPKGASNGRVCLIGKGVTFDSGGYSLKPTEGMLDMKMDMSGAAAVIGAFEGAVRLGVPWEVHVLVAAAENMVSGRAYRLGDVLIASNGKSVEINNTDAEGRLTMADALIYGSKLKPDFMVDFATLTGACIVALGPKIAGVMSKDDALVESWMAASDRSGEAMWRLPLPENLKEQLKSKVADMKNTGERWGGALTAGLFLSEFTEGCRWMHVDIAGPAMASKAWEVHSAGGTGVPVATILEFLSGNVQA